MYVGKDYENFTCQPVHFSKIYILLVWSSFASCLRMEIFIKNITLLFFPPTVPFLETIDFNATKNEDNFGRCCLKSEAWRPHNFFGRFLYSLVWYILDNSYYCILHYHWITIINYLSMFLFSFVYLFDL